METSEPRFYSAVRPEFFHGQHTRRCNIVKQNVYFQQQFERVVYTIERFNIFKAREKYRAVDHPFRISFTQRTVVKPVVPQPENFSTFAYSVFTFSELEKGICQNVLMPGYTIQILHPS